METKETFKEKTYSDLVSKEKERGYRHVAYIDENRANTYVVSSSVQYLQESLPSDALRLLRLGIIDPVVQSFLARGKRIFVTIEQDGGGKEAGHTIYFHLENKGGTIWKQMLEQKWVFPLSKIDLVLIPANQVPRFEGMKFGALLNPKALA
jgi:hypothetical protein